MCCSQDPSDLRAISVLSPDQRGEPVITASKDVGVHVITRSKAKENDSRESQREEADSIQKKEGGGKSGIPKSQGPFQENTFPSNKCTPAYTYESKATNPVTTKQTFARILNAIVLSITIGDLLAISPDLRREAVDYARTHRIPAFAASNEFSTTAIAPPHIEYSTPLHELRITLNIIHEELGLLDDGSEIVVICEDIWKASQAKINSQVRMRMQMANRGVQEMPGCIEMLEIDVEGLKTWAHAFIIPDAPYRILLGCPWQHHVHLKKDEDDDNVHITIRDPCNHLNIHRIATTPWPFKGPADSLAFLVSIQESVAHAL